MDGEPGAESSNTSQQEKGQGLIHQPQQAK